MIPVFDFWEVWKRGRAAYAHGVAACCGEWMTVVCAADFRREDYRATRTYQRLSIHMRYRHLCKKTITIPVENSNSKSLSRTMLEEDCVTSSTLAPVAVQSATTSQFRHSELVRTGCDMPKPTAKTEKFLISTIYRG
jgi:hypothetical protein